MTQYTLHVLNESRNTFDFCVYQKDPDIGVADVLSLAWFTKRAHGNSKLRFKWTKDYSFVWDETGTLVPGVIFDASEVLPADPRDPAKNAVLYEYTDGAYTFARETGQSTGHLHVTESGDLPALQSSVGIGMSGNGTFAVQAQPNLNLVFTPHPSYWITAGTFVEGQVLDVETITNVAPVNFPENVYSMTATLHMDNTWSVTETSKANLAARAAALD